MTVTGLLTGKVAVVTGASNGIGRAIALAFAQQGAAAIVLADLTAEPRDGSVPTHELIATETPAIVEFVACDVSDPADVEAIVACAATHGRLDVLANIAGISHPSCSITDLDDVTMARVIGVNLMGTIYGCRAAARVMIPQGSGSIINMSSITGLVGVAGKAGYCASKGAVRLLTYSLAAELGPKGIRVNALHPGVIQTDMMRSAGLAADDKALLGHIPSARIGDPEEIGAAAVFLASDLASYVNGASMPVDGGLAIAF